MGDDGKASAVATMAVEIGGKAIDMSESPFGDMPIADLLEKYTDGSLPIGDYPGDEKMKETIAACVKAIDSNADGVLSKAEIATHLGPQGEYMGAEGKTTAELETMFWEYFGGADNWGTDNAPLYRALELKLSQPSA